MADLHPGSCPVYKPFGQLLLATVWLVAGCELPLDPTIGDAGQPAEVSLVGVWILTSHVTRDSASSCQETSRLAITEHSASGALTWSLEQNMACTPANGWLNGPHLYHDSWQNTPWAAAAGSQILIQTPDPELVTSCRYEGILEGHPPTRMVGQVTCRWGMWTPLASGLPYQGTWEAVRQ
jgi:hypothetical protein